MVRLLLIRVRERPLASLAGMVGIIAGVALTVVTVGFFREFTAGSYKDQFESLASSFSVTKAQPHGTRATGVQSLSDSDVLALHRRVDPSLVAHVIPIAQGAAIIRHGNHEFHGGLTGGTADYLQYLHTPLTAGSMFSESDVKQDARVILLGPAVAKAIFPEGTSSAIGSNVMVGRLQFRVIGLLGKDATGGDAAVSVAPISTVRESLLGGIRTVGTIGIVATSVATVPAATDQVTSILEQEHTPRKSGLQDDFTTTTFASAQPAVARHLALILFWFVVCVAAASYLVGGIALSTVIMRRSSDNRPRIPPPTGNWWKQSGALSLPAVAVGLTLGYGGARWATALLESAAPQLGTPDLLCYPGLAAGACFGLIAGLAAGVPAALRSRRNFSLANS